MIFVHLDDVVKKYLECSLAGEEMIKESRLYLIEGVEGLVELVAI